MANKTIADLVNDAVNTGKEAVFSKDDFGTKYEFTPDGILNYYRSVGAISPSSATFGAKADGVTNDTSAIQSLVSSIRDGKVRILPGKYNCPGDIIVSNKGQSPNEGGFEIDATGAVFTGSGKIIFEGCKRVSLIGLDAPTHIMEWRGIWQSDFTRVRIGDLQLGGIPSAYFSSAIWNNWWGGQIGSIEVLQGATGFYNSHAFWGISASGQTGQGFTTVRPTFLKLNGNKNFQNIIFYKADISGYNEIVSVGTNNTSGDVEVIFNNPYFDTKAPTLINRNGYKVTTNEAHVAGRFILGGELKSVARSDQSAWEKTNVQGWRAYRPVNVLPNGDLAYTLPSFHINQGGPIRALNGCTVTEMTGEGPNGRYLRVQMPAPVSPAVNNPIFFAVDAVLSGRYSGSILIRNREHVPGDPKRLFKIAILGQTLQVPIGSEWEYFSVGPDTDFAVGARLEISPYVDDTFGADLDIGHISITYGTIAPLLASCSPGVIARGSNTNGEWERLVDGTQICWQTGTDTSGVTQAEGSLFVSPANISWTYPIAFNASPVVIGSITRSDRIGGVSIRGNPGFTSCNYKCWLATSLSAGNPSSERLVAIGRWR